MVTGNSLPSPAVLYGTFLLCQSYNLDYCTSWDVWVHEAKRLPTGLITPRTLEDTARLLLELGLCRLTGEGRVWIDPRLIEAGTAPTNEVLTRILVVLASNTPPVWVEAAVSGTIGYLPDAIPSADLETLRRLGLGDADPSATHELLLALSAPPAVNADMIGAKGEEAALNHEVERLRAIGRQDFASEVRRVSLISDRFGYDVASFFHTGVRLRIEVKTSTLPVVSRFNFFITRHEYNISLIDPATWRLMAVSLDSSGARVVGYMSAAAMRALFPAEQDGFVWTEARLSLSVDCFTSTP